MNCFWPDRMKILALRPNGVPDDVEAGFFCVRRLVFQLNLIAWREKSD
jgi:hypothetical protein